MDSHLTSKLRFLDVTGAEIGGPQEWMPAWVQVHVPADMWDSARLWRQDHELPLLVRHLGGEKRVLAEWPRSGAGHYRVRLDAGDGPEEQTVTIWPAKITRDAYGQLLTDLEARLPTAVSLGLQRSGALTGIMLLPPGETTLAQELLRLRRAVQGVPGRPGLAKLLPVLGRDPHHVLASVTPWVPRQRARRPHPAGIAQALAVHQNLDNEKDLKRVLDLRAEHTTDVYENRLVKAYVHQVALRLRRLVPALASKNGTEHKGAQALLDALLQARRQAPFLDDVLLPAQLPDHVTMVLVKRPAYRAAFEGYLEFRRTVSVRLDEPALEAPLENLPFLYQVWATLAVIEVLLDEAKKYAYKAERQRLVQRDPFGLYVRVLADGEPVLALRESASGAQVKLIPQRTYGRGHGLHSVSYSQIPDIAIEASSPTRPTCVYLLDPKYRLDGEVLGVEANPDSKPTKADIDKMHAYRDAIRDDQGNHVVSYAGILYPGPYMAYSQGLEALPAYPGREDALRDRIRVVCEQALAQ